MIFTFETRETSEEKQRETARKIYAILDSVDNTQSSFDESNTVAETQETL